MGLNCYCLMDTSSHPVRVCLIFKSTCDALRGGNPSNTGEPLDVALVLKTSSKWRMVHTMKALGTQLRLTKASLPIFGNCLTISPKGAKSLYHHIWRGDSLPQIDRDLAAGPYFRKTPAAFSLISPMVGLSALGQPFQCIAQWPHVEILSLGGRDEGSSELTIRALCSFQSS